MFIDDSKIQISSLNDRAMFSQIFNQYVSEKIFRPRLPDELEDVMKRHTVMLVGNTVL